MSKKPALFLDFHGRFIDALGIQMYQKPTAAIAELIANAWDADAATADVTLPTALGPTAQIVIADSGLGMTFQECQQYYLKVGRNRRSAGVDKTPSGRPVLGRKGIGKFAGFGISKRITVDTISRATGEHTVFEMDLDRLRSDEFIDAGRHEINVLEYEGPDEQRKANAGTKIILADLTIGRAQNPLGFAERMARRFLLAANTGTFAVTVNGTALSGIDIGTDVEFDFPTDYRADERPSGLVIQGHEGVEKLGEDEIQWRVRFRKETIGDEEFRGVAVFCGIKVAQAPFFFELSGGLSGQHGQQYMFGHVRADFIDRLGEDIITTERQRINWEHDGARQLLDWGQRKLKELLLIWKERRSEARQKLIDQKVAPFTPRLDKLQASERRTVTSAIKKIATISTLEDAEFADLAGAILTAWEQGRLRDIIGRIAALDEAEAGVILSVMGEAQILTALHVAEVVKTKLDLVRGLRKRVESKQLENAIRDYIAEHPWLVDPRLEFFRKEVSLGKIVGEVASAIKLGDHPDFSKRVDLLLASGDHLVLLEFLRPGVKLDRDHLDRFARYVDELRGRILAGTGGPFRRITGRLVADELTKSPGNMKAIERLEANDMYAVEWEMLLAQSERQFADYFEIMSDRAPDDARVRDLRPK
ncbi:MAG: ATP-binding protein [Pseudolabrys sp.]